jgi:biopolymer transport protein ExbD
MKRLREEDATFELNLAPMLDIIVSIVPMLLLSVVFTQITMIETPIPQAVQKAMAQAEKTKDVQISLNVSKEHGFKFEVINEGQKKELVVNLKNNALDMDGLHKEVVSLKQQFPNTFRMELLPEESVPLDQIVATMDEVRNRDGKQDPKIYFKDVQNGQQTETNLLFPDVVFGNVAGG